MYGMWWGFALNSSHKNHLSDGGSQGGYVVFLSDNKDIGCPLSWKSTKTKRIVRSTLAAETLAFTEGADTAFLMAKIVGEIVTGKESMIPIHCMTDNKSLFDASQTTNLISDKRLQVEIASIRQMIERNEIQIKWITSSEQIADCLTKNGASSDRLCRVLNHAKF